jgi:hypothetical protein
MRKTAITAACGLLFWAATPANAFHMRHHALPGCPRTGSRLIVADAQAAVYQAEGLVQELFGCAYAKRGKSYALGPVPEFTPSGGGGIEGAPVIAGPIVAYELHSTTPTSDSWLVVVRDLRTGKILHQVPTGESNSPEEVGAGFTTGIVVKSDGAVGWIVARGAASGGNQVHIIDKLGDRVVASGLDIEQHSLALAGNTLYWSQGGKPQSTTLN